MKEIGVFSYTRKGEVDQRVLDNIDEAIRDLMFDNQFQYRDGTRLNRNNDMAIFADQPKLERVFVHK